LDRVMNGYLLFGLIALACSQVHGYPYGNQSPEFIWDTTRCSNINPIVDSKTIILIPKGAFGQWPRDQFCHSIRRDLKVSDDTAYVMNVDFIVLSGVTPGGREVGYPGFAFNYWDESNYDFVFKKFDAKAADQNAVGVGSIRNGVMKRLPDIANNPAVKLREWYNFKVVVLPNKTVTVKLNDQVLGSFKAYFSTRGYGGVIGATGFNSVLQFRNFDVSPILATVP